MSANSVHSKALASLTLRKIDPSSWISWACYALGFCLATSPAATESMISGGSAAYVLIAAVFAFFVSTAMIQQHMQISLRASSFGHPKRLITNGVFRYSRNPIYVAFLVPLASLAALSLIAAVLAVAVYFVAMTLFVIIPEERVLTAEFGSEYKAYSACVPRWFGFI